MKTTSTRNYLRLLLSILAFNFASTESYASHAQSADLTYTCLGGNQYQINLSFYRDCAGVAAPNTVNITISSASCGQNFNSTLNRIANTGNDVTPICANMLTVCSGGNNPGVQEWKYSGIINLPMQCVDWTFGFQLCCRNNAINTINNPGGEDIYVEAKLDNENFPCNSSPSFSNPPIPFVCAGQSYCFNHGATDIDGDSLVYTLIPPQTSPTTNVNYLPGYSATQPLQSSPLMTMNPLTGDICMTPTLIEVTVMAVKVEEYRNGVLVGSVIRDIQLRTIACSNDNPYLTGINGTGSFQLTACAGLPINFNIPSNDINANQNVTISWNNGIAGATFNTGTGQHPTGTFSWTPTTAQISNNAYCFTVTVSDDNCPFNGTQTFSFCITVTGFDVNITANNSNCGAANGNASASINGGNAPYNYNWSSGSTQSFANGLLAGNYSLTVTDNAGCQITEPFTITNNGAPGNLNLSMIPVSCFNGNNGAATANMNGGQQPYTYLWSNGNTNATITGLSAGNYSVSVTTANGCISTGNISVTAPALPLSATTSQTNVTCNGLSNGMANVNVTGGTAPYFYAWNNGGINATENNLTAGNYSVQIMDGEGCTITSLFNITQPAALVMDASTIQDISCNGFNNGSITVNAAGGTAPYNYLWSNSVTGNSVSNLGAGNYSVTVTDNNGCTNTFVTNITEPQPIIINLTSTDVTCNGDMNGTANVFITGGTGNYSYNWNSGQTIPNLNSLDNGNYTITVTDQNSCTSTATANIFEPSPLVISVTGSGMICPGQIVPITVNAVGGNSNYTYHWSNGLGNAASQNVSPTTATNYTVYVTDANGCTSPTLPINITVNDINLATISVSGTPFLCFGNTGSVLAQISGGSGVYTYQWNNGLPNGAGPHSIQPAASGYYTVTILDNCGNSRTESVFVNVEQLPIVTLTTQSIAECGNVNMNFINTANNNGNYSYGWDFGDGNTGSGANVNHNYTTTGNYNVTLTMTSNNGCASTGSAMQTVVIYPVANAHIESDKTTTTIFTPEFRFYNTSLNSNSCFWNFGDGITSTQNNPIHKYENEGTYTVMLIAYNANGCNDTTYLTVVVNPEFTFYIPNAFTPDGDGINDTFFGQGTHIAEFNIMIFDRWGELLFTSDNLNAAWDGYYRGTESKPDVYVYVVKLRDDMGAYHSYEGHVTLVK
jgi:gliding motility-associated-like protein